jgi:hypothetical protein
MAGDRQGRSVGSRLRAASTPGHHHTNGDAEHADVHRVEKRVEDALRRARGRRFRALHWWGAKSDDAG